MTRHMIWLVVLKTCTSQRRLVFHSARANLVMALTHGAPAGGSNDAREWEGMPIGHNPHGLINNRTNM
jgi:hypothetical protein